MISPLILGVGSFHEISVSTSHLTPSEAADFFFLFGIYNEAVQNLPARYDIFQPVSMYFIVCR